MNVDWLLIAFVGALAILAAGVAVVVSNAMRARARVARRMRPLGEMLAGDADGPVAAEPTAEAAREENVLVAWLKRRFPLAGGVRVGVTVAITVVLVTPLLTAFLAFVGIGAAFALAAALAAAAALGLNVGKAMEDAKRIAFSDRFLLAMEDFQRMVRFGIPTSQALDSVTEAAEAPLDAVLRNALRQAALGVPLERAMAREARRIRIGELAMLAAILSTQANTGGNLSEAVGNLAEMLRERKDSRTKMKASTAESRLTLIILGIVPLLGIAIQAPQQPELLATLLTEARHLLGIGLGLIFAGFAVSYLMVRSAQR